MSLMKLAAYSKVLETGSVSFLIRELSEVIVDGAGHFWKMIGIEFRTA
jgi:hypothetical protein